jgi:outer membrane receptor protein involved in Fe transport
MTVFEYGSGNSTFWWSQNVSSVVSYEHDSEWYSSLNERVPSNVDYHHCNLEYGGDYCKAIQGYNDRFNIVVIDGRDRVNCVKNSLGALRNDGLIIWDNSNRQRYQDGYSFLLQNQFRRLDFEGLGPINTCKWCTSIFYRSENCFGI